MWYGSTIWDPALICAQIVTMQTLYYLTLGMLFWLLLGSYVPSAISLYYFFDSAAVSVKGFTGWMVITAYLANAAATAGFLCIVVERAKKCLDFSATLTMVHLFLCLVYSGFPSNVEWYVLNFLSLVIMAVLGEWLCMRRELREIPLSGLTARRTAR
ncbi:hypothetical protein CYMTET_50933 [Cymbomonas tetramitiformis]|uniref:Protein SYS1 homolog n=1 Tax=Cymbomonas tetramitiformis TaxID=36881 RepID=A0AAE0BM14_9CHLO|nr:hypothetical protein CYMTET_50933 [Cymbomonas tetramitiformis]